MSEQTGGALPPPVYLNEVEQLVGVHFFVDSEQATAARTNPGELEPAALQTYGGIYVAGLRILAAARRQFGIDPQEFTHEQRQQIRAEQREQIADLQNRLTVAAPLLPAAPEGVATAAALRTELGLGSLTFQNILDQVEPMRVTFRLSHKSRSGNLHIIPEDVARIRAAAESIPVATGDDVRISLLVRELQTSPEQIEIALADIGITRHEKRVGAGKGELAHYLSDIGAKLVRAYFVELENMEGLQSIATIAAATNTSNVDAYKQARWHSYRFVRRRYRDPDTDRISMVDCLPDNLAEIVTHELQIIVPDGCLTIGEYAVMRGLDHNNVRRNVRKHTMGTINFQQREKSITYLTPDTMFRLDRMMKPYEKADEHWRTMKELQAEFDTTDLTIAKHLTGEYENAMRVMKPREGDGGAIPHYSPAFRAYLRTVIKPKDTTGRTSLTDLIEQTGMTRPGLAQALEREGVNGALLRREGDGHIDTFYLDEELAVALPKLPKRFLPLQGVDIKTLAAVNHTSQEAMRQRLSTRHITAAGRYLTDGGVGNYYSKQELSQAGIRVPATPARAYAIPQVAAWGAASRPAADS
jgi:hypothetical protein